MNRLSLSLLAVAAVGLALVAVAFWISPRACQGGLETYFMSGVGAIVAMFALPFVARSANDVIARVGLAFGFTVFAAGAWIAGLFLADVQILCRLF